MAIHKEIGVIRRLTGAAKNGDSLDPRLLAARKSIILTSAISVVLYASSTQGINWAVNVSGRSAWTFLFVAHVYYYWAWIVGGGMLFVSLPQLKEGRFVLLRTLLGSIPSNADRLSVGTAGWLTSFINYRLTNWIAFAGLCWMLLNVVFAWLPGDTSTPAAHKATYPYRY